jgi:ribose transport system ATP-binding protein
MAEPVIRLTQIEKYYPGVKPLDRVDFDVMPGEIHALLGENGAGKTTLTHVIGGSIQPSGGGIVYLGKPTEWQSPRQAREAGIVVIHQELALFPELTVAENILGARQPRNRLGLISVAEREKRTRAILAQLGVDIPVSARVESLALADQQMVEIAKALTGKPRLLILDEPTAVISGRAVDLLFATMRRLKAEGLGIVYISHRLEEIFEIADRVTVLKDGKLVGTQPVGDLTREKMINMMVGRRLEQIYPPRRELSRGAPVLLDVSRLASGDRVRDVTFNVRVGEIVGIAGMVGSGRTEVAEAIFGVRPIDGGGITLDGKPVASAGPRATIAEGVGFLTEDRKGNGLFLGLSVAANIVAPALGDVTRNGLLDLARETEIARRQIETFAVVAPSHDVEVGYLSGGNQQKVLFSRWARVAGRLLILDEPTRGVDIGAKVEIYRIIRELAEAGVAVLMISSELSEVAGLSDRVVVMAQGRVTGEVEGDAISEEAIMKLAVVSHARRPERAGEVELV